MKARNRLIVGTGDAPNEFNDYVRVSGHPAIVIGKLAGRKGSIHLHLHGYWETMISPDQLRALLVNWASSPEPPLVTLSL